MMSIKNNVLALCGAITVHGSVTIAQAQSIDVQHRFESFDNAAEYGTDVATDGTHMTVGSPQSQAAHGAVYIYDIHTGEMIHYILGPTSSTQFGTSVSMDNGLLAVGAESAVGLNGRAFVYDALSGELLTDFAADDITGEELFGSSIDIEGDFVVVGAKYDATHANRGGAAYLFNHQTGQQLHKLVPSVVNESDQYGLNVAIHNGLVLVGGWASDRIYLFDRDSGNEIGFLNPGDGDFGRSFAVNEDIIAIEGERNIEMFDRDTLQPRLPIGPVLSGMTDVSMHDGHAIVGFGGADLVRIYDLDTRQLITEIETTDTGRFGEKVDVHEGVIAIGDYIGRNAFLVDFNPCNDADIARDYYVLDFFDVSEFIHAYRIEDPAADIDGDGDFDFFDVTMFIDSYFEGC